MDYAGNITCLLFPSARFIYTVQSSLCQTFLGIGVLPCFLANVLPWNRRLEPDDSLRRIYAGSLMQQTVEGTVPQSSDSYSQLCDLAACSLVPISSTRISSITPTQHSCRVFSSLFVLPCLCCRELNSGGHLTPPVHLLFTR